MRKLMRTVARFTIASKKSSKYIALLKRKKMKTLNSLQCVFCICIVFRCLVKVVIFASADILQKPADLQIFELVTMVIRVRT